MVVVRFVSADAVHASPLGPWFTVVSRGVVRGRAAGRTAPAWLFGRAIAASASIIAFVSLGRDHHCFTAIGVMVRATTLALIRGRRAGRPARGPLRNPCPEPLHSAPGVGVFSAECGPQPLDRLERVINPWNAVARSLPTPAGGWSPAVVLRGRGGGGGGRAWWEARTGGRGKAIVQVAPMAKNVRLRRGRVVCLRRRALHFPCGPSARVDVHHEVAVPPRGLAVDALLLGGVALRVCRLGGLMVGGDGPPCLRSGIVSRDRSDPLAGQLVAGTISL